MGEDNNWDNNLPLLEPGGQQIDETVEPPCTFDRRGVCKNHRIRGVKNQQKSRKWAKKKFGYGWITVTTTTYTCVQDQCDKEPPESSLNEALCIPNDGILNLSESLEDSRSLGGIAD